MSDIKGILAGLSDAPPWVLDQVKAVLDKASPTSSSGLLVEPGLSIFKYQDSRYWHARVTFRAPGMKDIRRSTRETDIEKAKLKAVLIKAAIFAQNEKGVALEGRAFTVKTIANKVIEQIKDSKSKKTTNKDYIRIFEDHIIPAFGTQSIRAVDTLAIKQYFDALEFRSKTQFVMHRSCFKKMFEFAVMNRFMQQRDFPKIPVLQAKDKETIREVFDVEDLKTIREGFNQFIESSRNSITLKYRELLPSYFEFLLATGIRTGVEPLSLRWRDLRTRQIKIAGDANVSTVWSIQVKKGKTESSGGREVALSKEAIDALYACFKARNMAEERLEYIVKSYGDQIIFSTEDGKRPPFEKTFAQYMEYIAPRLRHTEYTLYCTRHTYINDALARGVSHATIAKNCGNSVTTIEKHYEKLTSMLKANELINIEDAGRAMNSQQVGFIESNYEGAELEAPEISKEEMDLINSGFYECEPEFSIEEDEAHYAKKLEDSAKNNNKERKARWKKVGR